MKQSTLNTILGLTIIILTIIIGYRYLYSDLEHFENQPTQELNSVSPPPESTYNLQQYIESNPPIGSKVIKKEVKHILPDVMNKDITMGQDKQIRFGTMRDEVETNKDTFHLKSESDSLTPKLKLIMGDKQNKNPTFQIHGGACQADGNCSLDGKPLYKFDSQPNFKITNKTNQTIHELKQTGDAWHKGNVNAENVHVRGNLKVDGKINGNGGFTDESQQHYVQGTSNAKDVNVRGRLYFSQAEKGDIIDPHHKNFYDSNNWKGKDPFWRIHDSDPYYIEKIKSGAKNRLRITINDDPNEGIEIYSNSCGGPNHKRGYTSHKGFDSHACRNGPGKKVFEVDGSGNVWMAGNLNVGGWTSSVGIISRHNRTGIGHWVRRPEKPHQR